MRRVILAGLLLSLMAADARAVDSLGRADQGWTLGLGFGMGRADVQYLGVDLDEELREGVNTEWRLGKMANFGTWDLPGFLPPVRGDFSLTFDYQGWLLEEGDRTGDVIGVPVRVRQGLQIFGLGLTWYPGNPQVAWGGLVLRASAGAALANFAITVLDEDLFEVEEVRLDEWGWGVGFSAGYEQFVTDSVALGPMLNVGHLQIQEDLVESGTWVTLTLLGTWYF